MRISLRTLIALVGGAVALAVHRKANGLEPMQATSAEAHYSEVKYGTDSLEHIGMTVSISLPLRLRTALQYWSSNTNP